MTGEYIIRTMFLRSPIEQSFSIRQTTSPSLGWQLSTVNTKLPSAHKMDCPVLTDVARVGYEHANFLLLPLKL